MSDAAITAIVSGLITITTMVIGFLTLWVKLKYGADKAEEASEHAARAVVKAEEAAVKAICVEDKIDANTALTAEVKDAATKASEHAVICDEEKVKMMKLITEHEGRIVSIEAQLVAMKTSVDGVSRNIDSSRHEMRGHLQTLTNKLDLMSARMPKDA